ncbi:methyl-accepting chemotaxis protein [Pulveribacter sp.]|uniref:methyl-accepting chemotaxis protein n=1 Tax=Pulveribacter sp. TaxID=2678893 RepID=UPI0028AEDB85|nr:methyl-accepting chemotaxis protein [Pulveribacter sp.]
MALNNLRVGSRLGLGFGLILLITTVLALSGMWRIGVLSDAGERVATREIEQRLVVEEWAALVRLNWVRTEAFLKAVEMAYMEKLTADIKADTQLADDKARRIAELLQASGHGGQPLAAIQAARQAYQDKLEEIHALHRGGEPAVGAMVDQQLHPLADAYLQALGALRTDMEAQLRAGQQSTQALAGASQMLLGAGLALALALGAFLAWWVTRSIVAPLRQGTQAAEQIAQGDLTQPLRAGARDETGQLLQALAHMQSRLAGIVSEVRRNAEGVAAASTEIAQGNHDLSARTEQQAGALEQTSAAMEQLGATVRQNADNARAASQLAVDASSVAQQGGQVVAEVEQTMQGISSASRQIADIIGVIDSIAFQTNILALNAAVEAARAGEQGRGFAVVASEVRTLAGRSAQAAREIKQLIDTSTDRVQAGSALVERAGVTMREVVSAIQRVTGVVAEISAASGEQSQGVAQVGEAIVHMDQTTQQNAALVEQSAAASSSLRTQAGQLVQAVAVFKLAGGAAAATPPAATAAPVPKAAPAPATAALPGKPAGAPRAPARAPAAAPVPALAHEGGDWERF